MGGRLHVPGGDGRHDAGRPRLARFDGRPISEKAHVTETFRRVDADTLVWSETIDDPKIFTRPVETMRMSMRLHDPRTDIQEYYCSPVEQENYNKLFGSGASSKGAP